MKTTTALLLLSVGLAAAAPATPDRYVSLQQEMHQAIARGNAWLKEQQKATGQWDDEGLETNAVLVTAYTVLALEQLDASIPR